MYLHVGLQILLHYKDIVAILNLEDINLSPITAEFLEIAVSEKRIRGCTRQAAKSCIITDKEVYYSNISAHTLWKRCCM
jgi:hypothetical protein